jgi:hypothetical protein
LLNDEFPGFMSIGVFENVRACKIAVGVDINIVYLALPFLAVAVYCLEYLASSYLTFRPVRKQGLRVFGPAIVTSFVAARWRDGGQF